MENFLLEHIRRGRLGLNKHVEGPPGIELIYLGKDHDEFRRAIAPLAQKFAAFHGSRSVEVSRIPPVVVTVRGRKIRSIVNKLAAALRK